ncbi:MAG: sulfotransferase family 2 domain-containing protein [Candidatus Marinimicrobia bacterium]|nr:sulfotransferase family 2 domain-containing protein [Candidatus Neomarinimicrobiota bacterium]
MNKKALFMHIPKTGGISLYKAIRHPDVRIKGHFIQNPFHRYLKDTLPSYKNIPYVFTFVRNPWDRLVSAFFYLNEGGRNLSDKADSRKYLRKYQGDFETFIKEGITEGKALKQLHLKPQSVWVCDDEGNLLVDYIGRFESLQEDLDRISKEIGIPFKPLAHTNSSLHKHYQDYYTEETRAIVAKAYKKDIELFNYNF